MTTQVQTNLERNMAKLLNLEEEPEQTEVVVVEQKTTEQINDEKLDTDFDASRKNLNELFIVGSEALNYALSTAKQTDDPKAYVAVSDLIKKLADINEQILDLHLKHQRHKQKAKLVNTEQVQQPQPGAQNVTNNNAIFVGTTTELLKLIKDNGVNLPNVITDS